MKNAVIFTLIFVIGFMMFALLYQPKVESQENIGLTAPIIYFSPHTSRDTFLVDQGTGMVYLLCQDLDTKKLFWSAMIRQKMKFN